MKVLFVCSGNVKGFKVVPFIRAQGESIRNAGIDIDYFPVKGKGLVGYLKVILQLRKYLKVNKYDLIHGHFILSSWVALLGSRGLPVVISLMGSDAYGEYIGERKVQLSSRYLTLLTYLIQPFVKAIISKSANIERYVYLKKKSRIIPNGINTTEFKQYTNRNRELPGIDKTKKNVLFLGKKSNIRKNMRLVSQAIELLDDPSINLVNPYPVTHDEIPNYLNAADVLSMCSYMEGSPNVIKEAMACNCPIVATDVGDVKWVLGNTEGCYLASFHPADYATKLREALDFSESKGQTSGRRRIFELDLSTEKVASHIVSIYEKVLR